MKSFCICLFLVSSLFVFLILGCINHPDSAAIQITSSSFINNEYIPTKFTCDGSNVNPSLTIKNIPDGTKTLALIMDDPDAPHGTFVHWVVWNIAPEDSLIKENSLPGISGINSTGNNGYMGPCPQSGIHHYHFKVFAIDKELTIKNNADKKILEETMKNHVISSAELIGLYQRK